ncbi:MAG TPA: hypothetical protein VK837_05085 [Longimicrobiales bacterium]|nr:hypothetical protein [Longimicrobiales bacterium]
MTRLELSRRATASLLFAVALGACSDNDPLDVPDDPRGPASTMLAALGDTVTIGIGEAAEYEDAGLEVHFRRLRGDSRCPIDAQCIWAGDGAVELDLTTGSLSRTVVLHTYLEPHSAGVGNVTVELVDLLPPPVLDTSMDPVQYAVRIVALRAR